MSGTPAKRTGEQAQEIAATLRKRIVEGLIGAGSPLRQERLAEQFGTSRMPIRDALRLLEAEGLVLIEPNRGAKVAPLDISELQEIYEIRVAAETLALRLAIPELTNRQIDEAEEIQRDAESAPIGRLGILNKAFHDTLYAPCNRPRLLAHIAGLNDVADRYLRVAATHLDYRDRSNREHRDLLEACRDRNEERVRDILQRHTSEAGNALVRSLSG